MEQEVFFSDQINELAAALAEGQAAARAASKSSKNPYYNSKYADLEEVRSVHKEFFAPLGISVTQLPLVGSEREVRLLTLVAHKSGQWIRSVCSFPVSPPALKGGGEGRINAQSHGSAISYARRYSLAAALGIAADDDDSNAAAGRPTEPAEPVAPPAPPRTLDEIASILQPIGEAADKPTLDRICAAINKANPDLNEQIKQAYGVRLDVLKRSESASEKAA